MINFEPKEEQLAAVLSLLNMGIKHIPHAVLNSGFNQVTKMLLEVSTQYSKLGNNVIIKSVMGVLGAFLQAQEIVSWENPDVIQVFEFILNHFCLHSRPKVIMNSYLILFFHSFIPVSKSSPTCCQFSCGNNC